MGPDQATDRTDKQPRDHDPDGDKAPDAPETPLDEPRPPQVQDPPPESAPKGPYVAESRGQLQEAQQ